MWSVVRDSGTLEPNSPYAYLMLAAHFAETCVLAERDGRVVGFVAAFRSPAQPESAFVWQIGVLPETRGHGVGKELLKRLLARPACREVRYLEATVAPSNRASVRLFRGLARDVGAPCAVLPGFTPEMFPAGAHESEDLFRIGPLKVAHEPS